MTRLNAPTTASNIIIRISNAMVLQGAEYMVTSMKALGKDHLIASSYGTEKRAVLTDIIERTFPLETDTPEILKTIKDDRLLDWRILHRSGFHYQIVSQLGRLRSCLLLLHCTY